MHRRDRWFVPRPGSLNRLELISDELPPLEPGEARVRVHRVGLNFADIFACLGLYSATPKEPFTPGLEFAGEVEECRPLAGRPRFKSGARVMGVTRFGGYASRINADCRALYPLPRTWSFSEGAAHPVQSLTAWYGIYDLGAMSQGMSVLVQSAAGGVGLRALEILKREKARIVAVAGREEKANFLMERTGLARDRIVIRPRGFFASREYGRLLDRALEAIDSPEGFDLSLESVAGPYFLPAYKRLAPQGRLVIFGAASFSTRGNRPNYPALAWKFFTRPRPDLLDMISRNRSVMGFNLIWLWERLAELRETFQKMEKARLSAPFIDREFEFTEAKDALRYLYSGKSRGKVLLRL